MVNNELKDHDIYCPYCKSENVVMRTEVTPDTYTKHHYWNKETGEWEEGEAESNEDGNETTLIECEKCGNTIEDEDYLLTDLKDFDPNFDQ